MASLPLLDPENPTNLVGIARLAAMGVAVSEGHEVEYLTLATRSILNRCTAARMPFTWTINPYRGCEFACKYCYARYTHEFMELRDGVDFERKIYVKQHVAEQLRRDLKRVKRGEEVAIGTATDPYQPAERRFEVTRAILEELVLHEGLEIGIVSKSNLILRDRALLSEIGRRNRISINITVTTTDVKLARILEPRAPRPDLRLEALRQLRRAGIPAGVICAPVLPGITDSLENLESVVKGAALAGAQWIHANPLFLKPCAAAVFVPFLEKEFPQLTEQYRQRYSDRAYLGPAYGKRIAALMAGLRRRYGVVGGAGMSDRRARPGASASASVGAEKAQPPATQLSLGF